MWTRERYFPATCAHATWHRLSSFFRLPGHIVWGTDTVWVELRPFNDRRLNRDLSIVCERVIAAPSSYLADDDCASHSLERSSSVQAIKYAKWCESLTKPPGAERAPVACSAVTTLQGA